MQTCDLFVKDEIQSSRAGRSNDNTDDDKDNFDFTTFIKRY